VKQLLDSYKRKKPAESEVTLPSRKQPKSWQKYHKKAGINAKAYHAGLENNIRSSTQDDFK
jgi:ATP-dependent DNA helicase RecQ